MPIIDTVPGKGGVLPSGYTIYKTMWGIIDWMFPPSCAGCEKFGFRWCEECQAKTEIVSPNVCVYCERDLPSNRTCLHCTEINPNINQMLVWGLHTGPLRQALHKLKYQRDIGLGEMLANHLIRRLSDLAIHIDVVVPVPLGQTRFRQRGYNQASLLARPISLANRVPYRPGAIKRVRDTRTQVGLSVRERRENMAGAFKADPKQVSGKTILLVDDVMTTGATMESAASALKYAGAHFIVGIALAKAVKMHF